MVRGGDVRLGMSVGSHRPLWLLLPISLVLVSTPRSIGWMDEYLMSVPRHFQVPLK